LRFQTDFWLAHSNRNRVSGRSKQLPLRRECTSPWCPVLSPKGDVLDRWKLEQSVVLDVNGSPDLRAELGPAEFGGSWIGEP
jgi:hypothetical protein